MATAKHSCALLHNGTLLTAAFALLQPAVALAAPSGGTVSSGAASITQQATTTTILQSSNRAVIDWSSFNVSSNEAVDFIQPTTTSITLNRIHDQNPSLIDGQITANGKVWLVNPNGVLFGPDAQVDVGGLVATTANISNRNFMRGRNKFNKPGNPNAVVVNEGTITVADTGLAALVAPGVANSGIITANLGKVTLASGDTFKLDTYGDNLISFAVSPQVTQQIVANSGLIQANGGTVILTAAAGRKIVNSLINNSGIIKANSIGTRNGRIILYAAGSNAVKNNVVANKGKKSGTSTVTNSGILDASGYGTGETGGTISVLGDNVGVLSGSIIDASGDVGGGKIMIGGDFHGAGTTPTAFNSYVDPNAYIFADANTSGTGGNVAVWADNNTWFYGNIYARGGAISGDGGFVETSGHGQLYAGGYVDLTAANGNKGIYLLDPTDISIYGNVTPAFDSTDGTTVQLSSALQLWLDASNASSITLTYNSLSTTATGSSGGNTITVGDASQLVVGERIQIGGSTDSFAASVNDNASGSGVYTITNISGSTVTLDANLASSASGATLYGGYVSQINDLSTNGNNATQATPANMPLWISNAQNALGVMQFNGSNADYLLAAWNAPNDYTVVVDTALTSGTLLEARAANNVPIASDFSTGAGFRGRTDAGALSNINWTFDSNADVYTLMKNGTTLSATVNNLSEGSVPFGTGTTSATTYCIGRRCDSTSPATANLFDLAVYDTALSTAANALINQYESAKWNIALTGPGNATGETGLTGAEAQAAMASTQAGATTDGYSVFSDTYLARLSQTSDVILDASHNITIDLQGDTMTLAAGRNLTLTAGNQILTNSAGTISTSQSSGSGGNITFNATSGFVLGADLTLNSGGGAITLNGTVDAANSGGQSLTVNAGSGSFTIANAIGGTTPLDNFSATANSIAVNAGVTTNGGTISLAGITTVDAALNAGTGNITISDSVYNANNGGIILNSGADLSGYNVTLHSDNIDHGYGDQIRVNSGSQINATNSVTLQDDSTRAADDGYDGVVLHSGATVTTPTLTVHTGGSPIDYNGATLDVSGNIVFSGDIEFNANYTLPTSGVTLEPTMLTIGTGVTLNTQNQDFSYNAIYIIDGTLNAGTGNITLSDNINNGSGGGIILNNGASLNGYNVTLHSDPSAECCGNVTYGAQIRLNSGSQINGTHSVTLQDDSSRPADDGDQGVILNSGATVTTPTLTIQTGGSPIEYNGTTLTVSGNTSFINTGASDLNINDALSIGNLTIEADSAPTLSAAITSSGMVTFAPYTSTTTVAVAGSGSTLNITSGILGNITASEVDIGAVGDSGNMTVDAYAWGNNAKLISDSGTITVAGAQAMGAHNLTIETNATPTLSSTITSSGTVTVEPASSGTAVNVGDASTSGGLRLGDTLLSNITAGFLVIGDSTNTGAMDINTATTLAEPVTFFTNSTHDITIGGQITDTASGNAIVLASGRNIVNNAGTSPLVTANGHWLVYSVQDSADTNGASSLLATPTLVYSTSYPTTTGASGNAWFYSVTPSGTITITVDGGQNATYGGTVPTLTYGFACSDSCLQSSVMTGALTVTTLGNAGATITNNAGTYAITRGSLNDNNGYTINFTGANFTVNKKTLTPTMQAQEITYGTVTPTQDATNTSDVTWSGFTNGDTAGTALSGTTFTYGGATAGSVNNAGSYTLGISGITATNYLLGSVTTAALTIDKKTLTPTMQTQEITYGTVTPTQSATNTSDVTWSGFTNGDTASALGSTIFTYGGATAGSVNNAGSYTLGISGITATNYSLGSVTTANLTIDKKTLTPTMQAQEITYGTATPTESATNTSDVTWSGFTNGDSASVLSSTTFNYGGATAGAVNDAGSYTLGISGITATNYSLGSVTTANLVIDAKALSVIATNKSKPYDNNAGTDPALTYSVSGLVGMDANPVNSVSLSRTSGENAGGYTITASGGSSSNGNYTIGTYMTGTFTINPVTLTVTPNDATRTTAQANPIFTGIIAGFITGEDSSVLTAQPAYATAANNVSPVGTYNITASGAAAINYDFNFLTGTLTVTAAPNTSINLPNSVLFPISQFLPLANGLSNGQFIPYYSEQVSDDSGNQEQNGTVSNSLPPLPQLPTDQPLQIIVDPVLQDLLGLPEQI